jgi:hypothetical protein
MINREKAASVPAPTASFNSLGTSQQIFDNNDYKPNANTKVNNFKYFCSFCKKELHDESIIFKGISVCTACLKHLVQFMVNLNGTNHNKPKIIKSFRCFFCDNFFSAWKMTSWLIGCKSCIVSIRGNDTRVKQTIIEKGLLKISKCLRSLL